MKYADIRGIKRERDIVCVFERVCMSERHLHIGLHLESDVGI